MAAIKKAPTEVYVTKYALTAGIKKCKVKDVGEFGVEVVYPGGYNGSAYFSESVCSPTLEGAMKQAEAMRKKKLASLTKQIAKLEKLTIKVQEK